MLEFIETILDKHEAEEAIVVTVYFTGVFVYAVLCIFSRIYYKRRFEILTLAFNSIAFCNGWLALLSIIHDPLMEYVMGNIAMKLMLGIILIGSTLSPVISSRKTDNIPNFSDDRLKSSNP